MKLTIDGKAYEYDPDTLLNTEMMALEAAVGVTFQQWGEQLQQGSATALTGLVWLVERREQPALRFSDVVFKVASLEIEEEEADPTEPVPASS